MQGVVKRYGPLAVVDGADLELRRGERVVVCGASGSGKSTLISCVNGLVRHDSGTIRVCGIEVSHADGTLPEVRRKVGMVFQQFNLFSHMTVLENCTLGPMLVGRVKRADAEREAMAQLERLRIPEQALKRPAELSGGQQQRAAIARALCMKPELMLFDEPTSALDPETIKEVLDSMVDLAEAGMTMVVVTHEMGFARAVAHRIAFMHRGRVVQDAPPEAFFGAQDDERVRAFLGQLKR